MSLDYLYPFRIEPQTSKVGHLRYKFSLKRYGYVISGRVIEILMKFNLVKLQVIGNLSFEFETYRPTEEWSNGFQTRTFQV